MGDFSYSVKTLRALIAKRSDISLTMFLAQEQFDIKKVSLMVKLDLTEVNLLDPMGCFWLKMNTRK